MINLALVIGMIIIPALNLQADIVPVPIINHEHDMSVVGYNQVGHAEGTGWPSKDNFKVFLVAHNYLEFENLSDITIGNTIYLIVEQHIYTYKVVSISTAHYSDISWLTPTPKNSIVLQTCIDNEYRLMVYGELVE